MWADPGATRFIYYALTQGYGPFSELASTWLIDKAKPSLGACQELVRHCQARLHSFDALYTVAPWEATGTATTFLVLSPRDVYPLIEPTEKVAVSYLVGSFLAATVAHQCFHRRGFGDLRRLYHGTLIGSAEHCAKSVMVVRGSKIPDYIGFVEDPTTGHTSYHVVEAKCAAQVPYAEVVKGIKQALSVTSINGVPPASRNVSVSAHRKPTKRRSHVLTNFLSIKHAAEPEPARAGDSGPPLLLDGMYLLAMSAFFKGLGKPLQVGAFMQFESAVGLKLALHKIAHQSIEDAWDRVENYGKEREPKEIATLLLTLGESMSALDGLKAKPLPPDEDWTPLEGNWLFASTRGEGEPQQPDVWVEAPR